MGTKLFRKVTELPHIGHTFYCLDRKMRFQMFSDQLRVTELTNALKRGKECIEITLVETEGCDILNTWHRLGNDIDLLLNEAGVELDRAEETGSKQRFGPDARLESIDGRSLKVYRSAITGVRVYSPFTSVNRLKSIPKKWTIPHVIRGLLNGQIKVTNDMTLTDDYARDAADNFGKGKKIDCHEFAKDLICRPSGWWISTNSGKLKSGNEIGINCHHFNYRTGRIDFDGKLKELVFEEDTISEVCQSQLAIS